MGFSRQEYWSGLPFCAFTVHHLHLHARIPPRLQRLPRGLQTSKTFPTYHFQIGVHCFQACFSNPSSFFIWITISSVQSLSHVRFFVTPWIAARQASLSITISRSSLKLTSIKSVMPSSHRILCCPLLLLPPIPPSIRVFSNESTLCMRWPKYWRECLFIMRKVGKRVMMDTKW